MNSNTGVTKDQLPVIFEPSVVRLFQLGQFAFGLQDVKNDHITSQPCYSLSKSEPDSSCAPLFAPKSAVHCSCHIPRPIGTRGNTRNDCDLSIEGKLFRYGSCRQHWWRSSIYETAAKSTFVGHKVGCWGAIHSSNRWAGGIQAYAIKRLSTTPDGGRSNGRWHLDLWQNGVLQVETLV